jgi:hypothetical protein
MLRRKISGLFFLLITGKLTGRFLAAARNRGAERALLLIHRSTVHRILQTPKRPARAERWTRKNPVTVSRPGANRQFQFPE